MDRVVILTSELTEFSGENVTLLDNATCVFCGSELDEMSSTKEHVIGRRFVPKGKLDRSWNLIVRACAACNAQKSNLENDLSAISMQPNAWGRYAHDDPSLRTHAERKAARSKSARTNKPVKDSAESFSIKAQLGPGMTMTLELTAPPQTDSSRVHDLALLQVRAFFYWLTFNEATRIGHFWRGHFMPISDTIRGDWGNVSLRSFMDAVHEWEPRLLAPHIADGFFKVAIRKHPSALCWSWALEWNHNYRIVGFFGDSVAAQAIVDTFPSADMKPLMSEGRNGVRFRSDVPLPNECDRLFTWNQAPECARDLGT